jgi:hypothetical protein
LYRDELYDSCLVNLPSIRLFDWQHLVRLATVFAHGQTVVALLATELQSYIQGAGKDLASSMAIGVYIACVAGLLVVFTFSSMAVNERRAKEFFYYNALREGILIDFSNHDDVLLVIMGRKITSKIMNIGSVTTGLTACIISLWGVVSALTRGGMSLDSFTRLALVLFALVQLYSPYSEFFDAENTLISVSKFIEGDPAKARELLSYTKVQSEAVCLNRLSDIWRLQQIAQSEEWERCSVPKDEYWHIEVGFAFNQLKTADAENAVPKLARQNTLWAKLSFNSAILNSVKNRLSLGALVQGITPWTTVLIRLNFSEDFNNEQGRRARTRQRKVFVAFVLQFFGMLLYYVLLGVRPDLVESFTMASDLCLKTSESICSKDNALAFHYGLSGLEEASDGKGCRCSEKNIGNGECDMDCYNPECLFDGGDCYFPDTDKKLGCAVVPEASVCSSCAHPLGCFFDHVRTLTGHTDVTSVAASPDGQYIVSGSGDGSIKVWRMSDGSLVRSLSVTLSGQNVAPSVVVSSDGQYIASRFRDGTIKVWSMSDGSLVRSLSGHYGHYGESSVALSPDGQNIFSGSGDCTIKVWSMSDGSLVRSLSGHTAPVISVVVSSDGQYIVSGSYDYSVKVWSVSDGSLVRSLSGHTGSVSSVAVTPKYIVSGSWDSSIKIWR